MTHILKWKIRSTYSAGNLKEIYLRMIFLVTSKIRLRKLTMMSKVKKSSNKTRIWITWIRIWMQETNRCTHWHYPGGIWTPRPLVGLWREVHLQIALFKHHLDPKLKTTIRTQVNSTVNYMPNILQTYWTPPSIRTRNTDWIELIVTNLSWILAKTILTWT